MNNTNSDSLTILEMVAGGTISVDEADQLLGAITPACTAVSTHREPKFLRLVVESKPGTQRNRKIDIRVPLGLLRSGVEIAKSLPGDGSRPMTIALGTHTLALDLNGVEPHNLDEFIHQFQDLTTTIDKKEETLKLFCE
jgi:hypothetical protein